MPDTETASVFDLAPDEAHEARLDAEAEAAIAAGRVVQHEKVREWLTSLSNGEVGPPPKA